MEKDNQDSQAGMDIPVLYPPVDQDESAGTESENTPGKEFFFADAARQQQLDMLRHLTPYSQVLITTGERGMGKSALLRQFAYHTLDTWRIAMMAARPDMSAVDFERSVLRAFGFSGEGAVSAAEHGALFEYLQALREGAQVPILAVDDAHFLGVEALRALMRFCSVNDEEHVLGVLLFGEPSLEETLAQPELAVLRARVTHSCELKPFSAADTVEYIHRKYEGRVPLDDTQASRVFAASGGVPARINELVQPATEGTVVEEEPYSQVKSGILANMNWRLAALTAVGVVAVALAIWIRTLELPEPNNEEVVALPQRATELPLPPPETPAEPEPQSTVPPEQAQMAGEEAMSSAEVIPLNPPAEPAVPPVTAAAPVKPAEPSPPPAPAARPAPPPVTETTVASAAPPKAGKPATVEKKQESWLKSQPASHYTLQLMALRDEQTVRRFISGHDIRGKAGYYKLRRDGKTFYVLVYGSYASRAEAERAAKKLPASFGEMNPWVRSMGEVQEIASR